MRRITSLMASLGLLASVGCHHVAGVCDCAPPVTPCAIYGLYPAADYSHQAAVASTAPAATVETPKAAETPKSAVTPPLVPPGRD